MIFFSRFIVGMSRVNRICELTNVKMFAVDSNRCIPSFVTLVPSYAFVSARVIWTQFFIPVIFGVSAYTHVASRAIESIVVNMINLHFFRWIHNEAMKKDRRSFVVRLSECSTGIESTLSTFHRPPFVFRNSFIIFVVNYCLLTLSKWNNLCHFITLNKVRSYRQVGMLSKHPGLKERMINMFPTTVCLDGSILPQGV